MNPSSMADLEVRNGSVGYRSENGVSNHLIAEKERLLDLVATIRRSGAIAPANCWVTTFEERKGDRTYYYARLCSETKQVKKRRLGRAGSLACRDWQNRCKRRDLIREVEQQLTMVQEIILRQSAIPLVIPSSQEESSHLK